MSRLALYFFLSATNLGRLGMVPSMEYKPSMTMRMFLNGLPVFGLPFSSASSSFFSQSFVSEIVLSWAPAQFIVEEQQPL